MKRNYLVIKHNETIICKECENANTVITRFFGLMHRRSMPEGHGLLLDPCNQIHTFNMHFDIDVITLDKDNKILAIFDSVPPWKCKKAVKGGKKVLELNSKETEKFNIKCGDVLEIAEADNNIA